MYSLYPPKLFSLDVFLGGGIQSYSNILMHEVGMILYKYMEK